MKNKTVSSAEMEVAIANLYDIRKHIIVPNLSWGFFNHECDLFILRTSGYGFEVEIKRSLSDTKADFKKKMNHIDSKNRIAQLFYAFPIELLPKVEGLIPADCGIITVTKKNYNNPDEGYYVNASIHREAKRRKGVKKLTVKEQLKVARLGAMRIWTLKDNLNKLMQKNG